MGDLGWAAGPALVSVLSVAVSLGGAAVILGALAWVGAGWLGFWVPRYDPTRSAPAEDG